MRWLLIVLVLLSASEAWACSRCGYYSSCRYYAPVVQKQYVQPIVKQEQTDVYVVQNNYPQPLVAQGTSNVVASTASYQQSVLPLLEPNQYFSQELQLIKAATQTGALRTERAMAAFQRVMELQAPAVERLAAGQAAAMVLQAAGLDPAHNKGGSSSAVVVSNIQGKVQVVPLNAEQIQHLQQQQLPPAATGGPAPPPPPAPGHGTGITEPIHPPGPPAPAGNAKYPALSKFCFDCHGLQLSNPKGDFFIGEDQNIARTLRERFFDITQRVTKQGSGQMPPPDHAAQPTPEEKAAILNEIEAIIIGGSAQGG